MAISSKRLADEGIYLKEDRFKNPKEIYRRIGEMIAQENRPAGSTVLDVGCATGELLYHLHDRFPDYRFTGYDISAPLIERAREQVPDAAFEIGSVMEPAWFAGRRFDVVVCSGVFGILEEIETPFANLLACTRPGGTVIVFTGVSEAPIDTVMVFRRVGDAPGPWENGWNRFSKRTYENFFAASGYGLEWSFERFFLPFALPKREDPMRAWTIHTEDDPFQTTNGAGLLMTPHFIRVRIGTVPEGRDRP